MGRHRAPYDLRQRKVGIRWSIFAVEIESRNNLGSETPAKVSAATPRISLPRDAPDRDRARPLILRRECRRRPRVNAADTCQDSRKENPASRVCPAQSET